MNIEKHYERMVELFGDELPNPINSPIKFKYYVNLYFHTLKLNGENP